MNASPDAEQKVHWHRPGLAVLIGGAVVWTIATVITAATKDDILVPTVILVGSFVVPVAVVVSAFHREEQRVGTGLSMGVMLEGFLLGGTLGVLAAALLETYILPTKSGTYIVVAIVEETAKALCVVLVAYRLRTREPLDGMVLGAIVGAGFAAFESAGYAFDAYVQYGASHPFLNLLQTEINRALLSPFGHIIWTSILGGALFAATGGKRHFRITRSVVATYLGVVTLHALWDQAYGWSIIITRGLTGDGWHIGWPAGETWLSQPTRQQLNLFGVVYNGMLLTIGTVGALWFAHEWRRYRRQELAEIEAMGGPAGKTIDLREPADVEGSSSTPAPPPPAPVGDPTA